MSNDIKMIDIEEFCELGFLQEVNRQFLHPLGLALSVSCETDDPDRPYKNAALSGVWDYREDPEGMIFGNNYGCDKLKAENVAKEKAKHWDARLELFGFKEFSWIPFDFTPINVQPLDWKEND